MIHVMTVHWGSDRWIDIQLSYLKRFAAEPYRVYAFLNIPNSTQHRSKYFYTSDEPIELHPIKLNLLAEIARLQSNGPDDLLVFIDGDAFPVGDCFSFVRAKLRTHPLVAVKRSENNEDYQPHPLFCATTVGFWHDIGGDWKEGYKWKDATGRMVTDVGGNLLGILAARGLSWQPMLRTNKKNLHPVFFGIYEDVVYHHGAAFRAPLSRLDRYILLEDKQGAGLTKRIMQRLAGMPRNALTLPVRRRARAWLLGETARLNSEQSKRIYEEITKNPDFFRQFI